MQNVWGNLLKDRGVDPPQGSLVRDAIGPDGHTEIRVGVPVVGDRQDLREERADLAEQPLDDPHPTEVKQRLVRPHARGAPPGQDRARHGAIAQGKVRAAHGAIA